MSSTPSGLKMLHIHRSARGCVTRPERSGESVSRWNNLAPCGSALTNAAQDFDERHFLLSKLLSLWHPRSGSEDHRGAKENASDSSHVVSSLGEVSAWIEGQIFCGYQ